MGTEFSSSSDEAKEDNNHQDGNVGNERYQNHDRESFVQSQIRALSIWHLFDDKFGTFEKFEVCYVVLYMVAQPICFPLLLYEI